MCAPRGRSRESEGGCSEGLRSCSGAGRAARRGIRRRRRRVRARPAVRLPVSTRRLRRSRSTRSACSTSPVSPVSASAEPCRQARHPHLQGEATTSTIFPTSSKASRSSRHDRRARAARPSTRRTGSRDPFRSASRRVSAASRRARSASASPTARIRTRSRTTTSSPGSTRANIGDPIISPGDVDGGSDPGDRIGTLARTRRSTSTAGTNTMDAAIALTSTANVGTATPADGYGTPSPITTSAFVGQAVQKYGRTTGLQLGNVAGTNISVDVCYVPRSETSACRRRVSPGRSPSRRAHSARPATRARSSSRRVRTSRSRSSSPAAMGLTIGIADRSRPSAVRRHDRGPATRRRAAERTNRPLRPRRERPASASPGTHRPSTEARRSRTTSVHRGTSSGLADASSPTRARRRAILDTSAANGTTYYYKVSAENANGEGALSNEASTTPTDLVAPVEPLPIVDGFDRANENPLSDAGALDERVIGSTETGLTRHAEHSCLLEDDDLHGLAQRRPVRPRRRVVGASRDPAGNRQRVAAATCASSRPGSSAYDGYMLRTNQQREPTRSSSSASTTGAIVTRLTINQELAVGDILLLRAKGSAIEAWRHDGSAWSRLGVTPGRHLLRRRLVPASGFAARPGGWTTSGRGVLAQNPPSAPTALSALAGEASVSLSWTHRPSTEARRSRTTRSTAARAPDSLTPPRQRAARQTTFLDTSARERHDLLLQGVRRERQRRRRALERGLDDADRPRRPGRAAPDRRRLRPGQREPALGRRSAGRTGSSARRRRACTRPSNTVACSTTTTCTAWRNDCPVRPRRRVWARLCDPAGNRQPLRLLRPPPAGRALGLDGYMLRTTSSGNRPGPARAHRQRRDRHTSDDQPGTRRRRRPPAAREGLGNRGWRHDGSAWSRLGVTSDATYSGAGSCRRRASRHDRAAGRLRGADDGCAATRHRAAERAGNSQRDRIQLQPDRAELGGGHRQRRRDALPHRALSGLELLGLGLRRDCDGHLHEPYGYGPLALDRLLLSRARRGRRPPARRLLEHGERDDA